jgi:hypothetical protein
MGAALPVFAYLLGNMIDSFDQQTDLSQKTRQNLYYYLALGVAAFLLGTLMFFGWMILG